jgi:hypothetical protein
MAIFPHDFNQRLTECDGKGALLSHSTLGLLSELLQNVSEPTLVVCDKHGGRNRYGPLLQHFFPDCFVETHNESRACSTYRWGPPLRRVEVRFLAGGESFLPSALASMTAKYLREQAMAAFNAFWQRQVPGLRPTAGYPQDARRFWDDIRAAQKELGISEAELWRDK